MGLWVGEAAGALVRSASELGCRGERQGKGERREVGPPTKPALLSGVDLVSEGDGILLKGFTSGLA